MNDSSPADIAEVFRSLWRNDCEERDFVLHAVGIPSQVVWLGRTWALVVPATVYEAARAQLERYERENPPRRRPAAPEPLHGGAWLGSLAYVAVMLLVGYLAGALALGVDWLEAGALRAGPTRSGELWRAVTALTLHLDVGHLLANLGFGTVFGLLAGQLLGPGVAWASVLAAAASANLLNDQGDRWAYRWAPLIAGVILLGFTGAGGERTDVLAHLTGFAMGLLAGVAHAAWRVPRGPLAQVVAGIFALALLAMSWTLALSGT